MLPTNMPNPQTAAASQIANWQFQRGVEQFKFQMELDPGDLTEKTILDFYNSRVFYEPEVAGLMVNILKSGDVVIDVGANCGFFTALAGTLIGPRGHVMAFEPAAACVTRMRANLDRNGLANVSIIDRVATAQSGETRFYLNSDNSGGNALWDPGEWPGNAKSRANPMPISVTATTIDAEYKQRDLPIPKLIKVDTEGAEQRVLEGAMNLLEGRKVPFVVVELHEFALAKLGCTQQSLRGLMDRLGYSTFALYYSNSLPRFIPPGVQIRSSVILNILFSTPTKVAEYWPIAMIDPRL
jgi:FkbM family methyltransferase